MEIYTVGGAVRDELLGLPVKDRDFVVVGATPEQMLARNFKPVGKDFPVFLHPDTHEEYALARTERKTAPGYRGFVFHTDPSVTLEQDLVRRDLTINAMARDSAGRLIDPHGGQRDVEARMLRHVSEAFAEDPVRILRLARFAARFEGFEVAAETARLCQRMVRAGEVDALVAERVWQELSRGLMAARPWRMFEVLNDCGALARLLPELVGDFTTDCGATILSRAVGEGLALAPRWACLWVGAGAEAADTASARFKAPGECRALAELAARQCAAVAALAGAGSEVLLATLERCDALRRPARFGDLLAVVGCAHPDSDAAVSQCRRALEAARGVDAGAVARSAGKPSAIPGLVRAARLSAIETCLSG